MTCEIGGEQNAQKPVKGKKTEKRHKCAKCEKEQKKIQVTCFFKI
jgi:hypothetical protein